MKTQTSVYLNKPESIRTFVHVSDPSSSHSKMDGTRTG
jgi:hypothetical protein